MIINARKCVLSKLIDKYHIEGQNWFDTLIQLSILNLDDAIKVNI